MGVGISVNTFNFKDAVFRLSIRIWGNVTRLDVFIRLNVI